MTHRIKYFGEIQVDNVNCAPFVKPLVGIYRRGRKSCCVVGRKSWDKCGIDETTTRRVAPHRARTGNKNASVVLNFVYIEGREAL